jgi:hypothetical protein
VIVRWKPGVTPQVLTSDNMILDLAKKGQLTATKTAVIVNATRHTQVLKGTRAPAAVQGPGRGLRSPGRGRAVSRAAGLWARELNPQQWSRLGGNGVPCWGMNPGQQPAVVKVAALRSRRASGGDQMTAPRAPGAGAAGWRLAGIGLLAAGVAAALYVAGRLHRPDYSFSLFGADPVPPKSVLATIALGLAVLQVLLALWMYRKLPLAGRPPRPVPVTHRVTGFALVALTVPVAVHCLIAYGVQLTSPRVAVHSVAGCFFYGAFTAKVLLVRSRRLPGWALPAAGGMLAIIIGVLWYTSALWYYNAYQPPHP